MFTGIITDIGTVRSREDRGDTRLVIATAYDVGTIDLGASIACSGACLTVVDKGVDADSNGPGGWFAIDASAETLARTAPGMWDQGRRLNLERALKIGDELGGHIVSGHVDGKAEILSVEAEGDATRFRIRAPEGLERFVAPKGSIALDGTSLTVNAVDGAVFDVLLIRHTLDVTTWGERKAGDFVNFEVDTMARYAARLAEFPATKA